MHFALNGYWAPLDFELPPLPDWATSGWRRVVDTALAAPDDISTPQEASAVAIPTYRVGGRAVAVFFANAAPQD